MLHGLAYMVGGFVFLGLMGQVHMDAEAQHPPAEEASGHRMLLEICGFVVSVYGQLFRSARLWRPLGQDEVYAGARVLCHLATGIGVASPNDLASERVMAVLGDLKLVREDSGWLTLTAKGLDFIRKAHGRGVDA